MTNKTNIDNLKKRMLFFLQKEEVQISYREMNNPMEMKRRT